VSARPEVRSALIRSYQHAIAKWDIDGLRIDTLKYIEPDFALVFGNAIREFALEIGKANFFTFAKSMMTNSRSPTLSVAGPTMAAIWSGLTPPWTFRCSFAFPG